MYGTIPNKPIQVAYNENWPFIDTDMMVIYYVYLFTVLYRNSQWNFNPNLLRLIFLRLNCIKMAPFILDNIVTFFELLFLKHSLPIF